MQHHSALLLLFQYAGLADAPAIREAGSGVRDVVPIQQAVGEGLPGKGDSVERRLRDLLINTYVVIID